MSRQESQSQINTEVARVSPGEAVGVMRADWRESIEGITRRLNMGGLERRGIAYTFSQRKAERLKRQLEILTAKLDGVAYPGKAARKSFYRSIGRWDSVGKRELWEAFGKAKVVKGK